MASEAAAAVVAVVVSFDGINDWEKFITENEKCRVIGFVLSDNQWENITDFFIKPVVEGGMEFPTQISAGGITMGVLDKTMKFYPVEPLLRAVVARTISGIEMMEASRQQARLLLTSPVKEKSAAVSSLRRLWQGPSIMFLTLRQASSWTSWAMTTLQCMCNAGGQTFRRITQGEHQRDP